MLIQTRRPGTCAALLGAVALILFTALSAHANEPLPSQFTWIAVPDPVYGDPDPTAAVGINAKGQIVGGYYDEDLGLSHGFLLDHGVYNTIDFPSSLMWPDTYLDGINASGDMVGSHDGLDENGNFVVGAFLFHGGTFSPINPPGAQYGTYALGINSPGQIVGSFVDANFQFHGYLLSGDVYTIIDAPGSQFTLAIGINAQGQIVGSYVDANSHIHGFLLDKGVFTTIDAPWPTGLGTQLHAINDRGEITGFYDSPYGGGHGFVLSGGKFTQIDAPGAYYTLADGINAQGQIVGSKDFYIGFLLSR